MKIKETAPQKKRRVFRTALVALSCVMFPMLLSVTSRSAELLPDLIVTASSLEDNLIVQDISPGRIHLRLSTGVANNGDGPLYLRADGNLAVDSVQPVFQRIFDNISGYTERQAGEFIYHPQHGHIHFANWAQFRLRTILPGDSVGPIVALGSKVTFCIVDEDIFNPSLPNFDQDGRFYQCGTTSSTTIIQGISVGWVDTYDKTLPDQVIDITEVPVGEYWLEAEADPLNLVKEIDETNNVTRIKYQLQQDGWDSYEANDYASTLSLKPFGTQNSSNLGPCGPQRVVENLNLHDGNDRDHFRFIMNSTGTSSDFIEVEFTAGSSNLGLQLLDSTYTILRGSITGSTRRVSLSGYPTGWYFAKVYSLNGQGNAGYSLTIDPPTNLPPSITIEKPVPESWIADGDLFNATWQVNDPENGLTWVSIFVDTLPILNGDEFELPQSHLTPGEVAFHAINTAHLNPGEYFVYAQITDGGAITGSWSQAPLRVVTPNCCDNRGDLDALASGIVDLSDLVILVDHLFIDFNPLRCPLEADLDGQTGVDLGDLIILVDHLFINFTPLSPCNQN